MIDSMIVHANKLKKIPITFFPNEAQLIDLSHVFTDRPYTKN